MKYGLSEENIKAMNAVFSAHNKIQKVLLYGSRAKGNFQPYSDIDLSLCGNEISLSELFEIELALDDLLLPYKIDLSNYSTIENPDLINHIDRVGITFYEKPALPIQPKPEQHV